MEVRKCLQWRGGPDLSTGVRSTYVGYTVYTEIYEAYYLLACVRERINN